MCWGEETVILKSSESDPGRTGLREGESVPFVLPLSWKVTIT